MQLQSGQAKQKGKGVSSWDRPGCARLRGRGVRVSHCCVGVQWFSCRFWFRRVTHGRQVGEEEVGAVSGGEQLCGKVLDALSDGVEELDGGDRVGGEVGIQVDKVVAARQGHG